jgi:superfamily II DNA or RNA helicase
VHTFTRNLGVGRVQGDKCVVADFTVVMLQTVSSGRYPPETFKDVGLLIVDEVHHLPARTFSQVAKYFTAKMTLGLSATLKRGDGNERCVFWQLGPLLATAQREVSNSYVQMKVGVKIVRGVKTFEPTRYGRLDRVRLITLLVKNSERNALVVANLKIAIDEGYNVLVISERIDQLHQLTALLAEAGTYPQPLEYVGERTQKRRQQRDDGLLESPQVVMTTKQMAAEAFDWKDCTCVLLATPVPVGGALEQIVGRCQRSGKEEDLRPRLVIDVGDTSPVLAGMTRSRVAWYDKKGYAIVGCETDPPPETPA